MSAKGGECPGQWEGHQQNLEPDGQPAVRALLCKRTELIFSTWPEVGSSPWHEPQDVQHMFVTWIREFFFWMLHSHNSSFHHLQLMSLPDHSHLCLCSSPLETLLESLGFSCNKNKNHKSNNNGNSAATTFSRNYVLYVLSDLVLKANLWEG